MQAGSYRAESFAVAASSYLQHKGGKQPLHKKKAAFPFKGRPKGCKTIRVWPQGSSFETKRKAVSVQLSQTDKP